jgi:hypothetical protein
LSYSGHVSVLRDEISNNYELFSKTFITRIFLSFTDATAAIFCSHLRSLIVYTEALASKCTLWGVKPEVFALWIRYDNVETGQVEDGYYLTHKEKGREYLHSK